MSASAWPLHAAQGRAWWLAAHRWAPQKKALRAGVDILIATPGRLLDHMRQNQARFDGLHTLVLDEADRMLDMGFLPDLKRIIARLHGPQAHASFLGDHAARHCEACGRYSPQPAHDPDWPPQAALAVGITQAAYPVAERLKGPLLRHLLRHTEMPLVLVFTRTKQSAKRLARSIGTDGFAVAELHSNLTQPCTPAAPRHLEGFRRGAYQVVVATNIAARGLDVENITHVISYDVPNVPDDYVHRIGRTARADAEGDAFVLVSPGEEKSLAMIERQIGQRLPRITLPDFDYNQPGPDGPAHRPHLHGQRDQRAPQSQRGNQRSGGNQRRDDRGHSSHSGGSGGRRRR